MDKIKKYLVVFAMLAGVVACGVGSGSLVQQVLTPTKAEALQGITGVDALMGVPCIASWVRSAPHICTVATSLTVTTLAYDVAYPATTCRSVSLFTAYGIPTSSNLVTMYIQSANFQNVIYLDSSCTLPYAISNDLFSGGGEYIITLPIVSGVLYYKSSNGGSGGGSRVLPLQYYD